MYASEKDGSGERRSRFQHDLGVSLRLCGVVEISPQSQVQILFPREPALGSFRHQPYRAIRLIGDLSFALGSSSST